MAICMETLPTTEDCAWDIGALLEGMSDVELDWILFENREISVAEFSRKLMVGYAMMETGGETEVPMSAFLMYPVRFENDYILGRNFCVTDGFFEQMYPLEDMLEQRFVVDLRGKVPVLVCTVRMSSGRTLIMRDSAVDFFASRSSQMYEMSEENKYYQRPILSMSERFLCYHCAEKNMECHCPSRASVGELELFEDIYAKATTPCAKWLAWTSLFSIAERLGSRISMRLTPIVYSDDSFSPAPCSFRKLYRFASNKLDVEFMFQTHLGLISIRPGQSVTENLLTLMSAKDHSDDTEETAIALKHPGSPESERDPDPGDDNAPACPHCGRVFSRKYEMQRHVSAVHERVKNFGCDRCGKFFALKQNLISHIEEVHEGKKDAVCIECDVLFSTRYKLRRHIRSVHLKERSHQCDECGKTYFQRTDLRRHIDSKHTAVI
ncbi:hypothetical protein NDN08_004605 [Rhodosorus marinus]|uniref:C2H2-type domain-containing protein n=1 Tax=Rhodosorus marinus TaxID=101924 RepID=A0AAV8ULQ7_9RHOD|nr:hypothetical protein NDN08_004605 [Rhodosorus marinus]